MLFKIDDMIDFDSVMTASLTSKPKNYKQFGINENGMGSLSVEQLKEAG